MAVEAGGGDKSLTRAMTGDSKDRIHPNCGDSQFDNDLTLARGAGNNNGLNPSIFNWSICGKIAVRGQLLQYCLKHGT